MNALTNGQFYGLTNQTVRLGGLTLTDTEYTHDRVDWHFHENPYFTFVLEGKVLEGNRKETYHCGAGSLLFHNWQEAHYNTKPKGYTRGFHVEINADWFNAYDLPTAALQGSMNLPDPHLKTLMYCILKEAKLCAGGERTAINSLLVQLLSEVKPVPTKIHRQKPAWVTQLRDLLHDVPEQPWTLEQLAGYLSIHPVYLCRQFPGYFGCHFGEYVRMIRLQKALRLMFTPSVALTEIAFTCGFADQSHFIRSFKAHYGITPFQYRQLIVS